MVKKYSIGLLIGRFQPFHLGHLWLCKRALEQVDYLKIGIGSANVKNEDNFLSCRQREKIIQTVAEKENFKEKVLQIACLPDFPDDNLWFKETLRRLGVIDVVVGNNNWTNSIFKKAGYPVLEFGFYKRYLYEGEKIRRLMRKGGNWDKRVPDYIISIIESSKPAVF